MPKADRDVLLTYREKGEKEFEEFRAKNKEQLDSLHANRPLPVEVVPEHLRIGQPYLDFDGRTPDGAIMKLSEILPGKKLILLDFWASWCVPCIKEMPNIAAIYEKYKDQGLVVIGITSDTNESAWKKAIERHNMTWLQWIDTDKTDRIGMQYNVKSIPYTYLIDANGVIVGRRLRGEELRSKIDELMTH